MTNPVCFICRTSATHNFEPVTQSRKYTLLEHQESCSSCEKQVRTLKGLQKKFSLDALARTAGKISLQKPSIIRVLRGNQPTPDYRRPIKPIIKQAQDPKTILDSALIEAATAGDQQTLNRLVRTDNDRAVAIAYAAPNHMKLVQTLLDRVKDPTFVRGKAIVHAASNNRAPALNALIETDSDRAFAIAAAAPDHMELVQTLLDDANDPAFVRGKAIINATLNNKRTALNALIQTDKDRGIAAAFAASNHMDLAETLLSSAEDPSFVREEAIIHAASNNRGAALNAFIQTDQHRAIGAVFAAPKHKELLEMLLAQAKDPNFVREEAIALAKIEDRESALEALTKR